MNLLFFLLSAPSVLGLTHASAQLVDNGTAATVIYQATYTVPVPLTPDPGVIGGVFAREYDIDTPDLWAFQAMLKLQFDGR
jgi:hypothetical protein